MIQQHKILLIEDYKSDATLIQQELDICGLNLQYLIMTMYWIKLQQFIYTLQWMGITK